MHYQLIGSSKKLWEIHNFLMKKIPTTGFSKGNFMIFKIMSHLIQEAKVGLETQKATISLSFLSPITSTKTKPEWS